MQILENLYDCADTYLKGETYDWNQFCTGFCDILGSEMALYRVTFDENRVPQSFEAIVTSMPEAAQEYKDRKLYALNPLPESDMAPLEPIKRSDFISDEQFMAMDIFADFYQRHGYFYQLIAPAILPDGSFLGLLVWRNENQADYTAADKQRIALFMRHLLAKVEFRKLVDTRQNSQVDVFGTQHGLTKTEIEILSALLDGHSLRGIAENTKRTYGTTRWHVQNILSKCQVNNQKTLLREFYKLIPA